METFAPKGKICGPILPQFILEKSITFGAKVMYALLCNYASEKDHCWPSHATLAARLSCSVSSIKNYLTELVRENLISVRREKYRSSVYYLLCPKNFTNAQRTNSISKQSEVVHHEAKSGYINNLNKKNKETNSPLPPVAREEPQSSPCSPAPAAGGVSSPVLDFENVWNLYPKKEAKGFARLAWLKLLRDGQLPPLSELHAAIRRFAASESWQREQGRFVPQLGNWLRGQRWLDPLPPAEQPEQQQGKDLHQVILAHEEREQRQHEQWNANKARLRPLFDAFAAKFAPSANNAMSFGMWLHLHSQNLAPSAPDVPPKNALGIVEFMNEFKRKAQTAAYRENHGTSQAIRREAGTSECSPLGELLKTLPSVARFFQTGTRSGWPLEPPVTACA
ncbi:helix-turn-helix domain-containing protein [Desulfovibrio sp.]|uniref:helix-turn-helix domain-containing protein n=1 Tax=Desulfovibrio sp. TaxID=885 RepID=UPI0025BE5195|nr:helix-turn-helix domain-containing protein [Desulfovibrio sp.]